MSYEKQLIHIKAPNSSTQAERDEAADVVARMFPGAGVFCSLDGWSVEVLRVQAENVEPEHLIVRTYKADDVTGEKRYAPNAAEAQPDPKLHVWDASKPHQSGGGKS